jgi:hypothetical protein
VLWDITAERADDSGTPEDPNGLNFQIWADSEAEARLAADAQILAAHPEFAALQPTLTIRSWAEAHRN